MISARRPLRARFLGYSLATAGVLFLVLLSVFFFREWAHPDRVIRVRFPEISTLSEGDPVVEHGVTVGKVRRIALENGRAVIELRLFHHRSLAEDTRFLNVSHSLMGARKVWMVPGSSPLPFNAETIHEGIFVAGLPETLHRVSALTERIMRLRAEADRLFAENGSLSAPFSIPRRLEEAMANLASMTASLEGAGALLKKGMEDIVGVQKAGTIGLRGAESGLAVAAVRAEALRAYFEGLEAELAVSLARVERLAAIAADSAGGGALLSARGPYEGLLRATETLTTITRRLRDEGLGDSLKVLPRRRP